MPVCIVMWGCVFRLFFYASANERLEQIYYMYTHSLCNQGDWKLVPHDLTLFHETSQSAFFKLVSVIHTRWSASELAFFLLSCTLNDSVRSNVTSVLFCFLFRKDTCGHQDSPLKLVPQLSRFCLYSSFTNNPSISKKEKKRKPGTVC